MTAEPLENLVTEAVLIALDSPDLETAMVNASRSDDAGALADQIKADELALEQLSRDHYVDEKISRAEFFAARDPLVERIDAAKSRIAADVDRSVLTALPGSGEALRAARAEGDVDWRRAVIQAAVDHIVIKPGTPGRRKMDPERVELAWRA